MVYPNVLSATATQHTQITGQEVAPHPPRAEYLATLSKHTAAVNVVRFSPNGQILASAGDGALVSFIPRCKLTCTDGNIILWVPSDRPVTTFGESSDDLPDKEHWRLQKMLQLALYVCCPFRSLYAAESLQSTSMISHGPLMESSSLRGQRIIRRRSGKPRRANVSLRCGSIHTMCKVSRGTRSTSISPHKVVTGLFHISR